MLCPSYKDPSQVLSLKFLEMDDLEFGQVMQLRTVGAKHNLPEVQGRITSVSGTTFL